MRIKFRGINPLRWGFGYWHAPRGAAVIELGPIDIYLPASGAQR
ncbi:hypothetical protein [Cupriavidus metallidurans]|nr:hypothetical protein [Cupriavidus metallidurans]MDE4918296.1 hypothetical protein [Cupriavidus metallidurans]